MNTRIRNTFLKAIMGGVYEGFLDCYNDRVVTDGICITVTTRIVACSHYWVLEYED
jgi:hypothetical protein